MISAVTARITLIALAIAALTTPAAMAHPHLPSAHHIQDATTPGAPMTVIIRSAPATGFDWTAALIGGLAATAVALLAYGAVTLLRSHRGELTNG